MLHLLNRSTVLPLFLGTNALVFGGWYYANSVYQQYRDPRLLLFMKNHFLFSSEALQQGRWWTAITCNFSHNQPTHFLVNMFVLYSFGSAVVDILGPRRFASLYVLSGLASSVAHVMYDQWRPKQTSYWGRPVSIATHGASGSISACSLIFALTYPSAPVYLFMFIPLPAIIAVGGFVAYDLYNASRMTHSQTNYAAHVGGAAFGMLYWFLRVRKRF